MLPVLGAVGIGLKLLPQVPKMWGAVASIFGKGVPKSVEEAGKLAGEVMGKIERGEVSPEQIAVLEARIMEHKETMTQLQNEKEEMRLKDEQHQRDTQVQLWASEANSTDIEVKRTRPKILKEMWRTCQIFILVVVIAYAVATFMPIKIEKEVIKKGIPAVEMTYQKRDMSDFTLIVKYLGAFLFSTFSAGFLGYTVARTVDKKNPEAVKSEGATGKIMRAFLGGS